MSSMKMRMAVLAVALLAAAAPVSAQQLIVSTGGTLACSPQISVMQGTTQTTVTGFTPQSYSIGGTEAVTIGSGGDHPARVEQPEADQGLRRVQPAADLGFDDPSAVADHDADAASQHAQRGQLSVADDYADQCLCDQLVYNQHLSGHGGAGHLHVRVQEHLHCEHYHHRVGDRRSDDEPLLRLGVEERRVGALRCYGANAHGRKATQRTG